MELNQGGHETSKFEPEDVVSNIPDIVITNILERLPLQDAVRTSVLSKNWRFKWTSLSQLVFDDGFFEYLKSKRKLKNSLVISRILLHLRGVITKFVLSIEDYHNVLNDEDINHFILFLSAKGIKDLTLKFVDEITVKLPTHLFSCLELKHLNLHNCNFHSAPPTTFHGFPNLLSMELHVAFRENSELVKLFSRCPLLESLKLADICSEGKVELIEILKVKSLKVLSLSSCGLGYGDTNITSSSTIFELVGSLPNLQELDLDFNFFKMTEDVAKDRFSTAFPSLKTLKLSKIYLDHSTVPFAFKLIMSFPNLQTLEITSTGGTNVDPSPEIENNTVRLFQLWRVVFKSFNASAIEVCLIKWLLACSPLLQRIVIHPRSYSSSVEKLMFAMELLKLPRASTAAQIDFFGI